MSSQNDRDRHLGVRQEGATTGSRRLVLVEAVLASVGIAMIAIALMADSIGLSSPGFGMRQTKLAVAGCLLLLIAAIDLRKGGRILGDFVVLHPKQPIFTYWSSAILAMVLFLLWNVWLYPESGYDINPFHPAPLSHKFLIAAHLSVFCLTILFVLIAVNAGRVALRLPRLRKDLVFGNILAALLLVTSGAILEILSATMVPPWPARDLRPVQVTPDWERWGRYNSWGVRDVERTLHKPPGMRRVIFLGDSFLEGGWTRNTLAGYVCDELHRQGKNHIECVNLGIGSTGPRHYLYRMRSVGMRLSPDAVLLFIYAGNDFVNLSYEDQPMKLIDERPLPSILGTLMPRFTWLLVNRLRLSEFGHVHNPNRDEFEDLQRVKEMPYKKGIAALADYMKRNYYPDIPRQRIKEILRRGGPAFWQELEPREKDREYLLGWRVRQIIELGLHGQPKAEAPIEPDSQKINATASYVEEIAKDLQQSNIHLVVFLIPIAENVDPEYRRFWQPWYKSDENMQHIRVNRQALFSVLRDHGIVVVDLAETLNSIPGTYRKFDGHWNEKGHKIVAARVLEAIATLAEKPSAPPGE